MDVLCGRKVGEGVNKKNGGGNKRSSLKLLCLNYIM